MQVRSIPNLSFLFILCYRYMLFPLFFLALALQPEAGIWKELFSEIQITEENDSDLAYRPLRLYVGISIGSVLSGKVAIALSA